MTTVTCLVDGFVGYGDGEELQVEVGQAFDVTHPLVVARPELFTAPPPPAAPPAAAPPAAAPKRGKR